MKLKIFARLFCIVLVVSFIIILPVNAAFYSSMLTSSDAPKVLDLVLKNEVVVAQYVRFVPAEGWSDVADILEIEKEE